MKSDDFTVKKNECFINNLLELNPKIFVKIKKDKYEQIYIDEITKNGSIIMYDNKFNRRLLSKFIKDKRELKKASTILRFIYFTLNDSKKERLYDYLSQKFIYL
tara:strand:+ start:1104 stop:1415 length:312 start_codon:yes stop_codon:yes gene_type:complete